MRIAELIDRNYGRVHIFLRSLSGSAVVADDLTQEAFLRLLKLRVSEGRMEERLPLQQCCKTRHNPGNGHLQSAASTPLRPRMVRAWGGFARMSHWKRVDRRFGSWRTPNASRTGFCGLNEALNGPGSKEN